MQNGAKPPQVQYIVRLLWRFVEDDALWAETLPLIREADVDAVMFFNADGEMPPYPALEEIPGRVAMLNRRFAEVRNSGMVPMLNYFVTLGHGASTPGDGTAHFQWLTDGFGHQATGCACPLDPEFQRYITAAYGLYASSDADSIWIDDDYRLYSREGANTLQCFCPWHMKRFFEHTGLSCSRSELFEKLILTEPADRELRRQWFEVQGTALHDLACMIKETVSAANPHIGMGIMVVPPSFNYLSGLDLNKAVRALRTEALPMPWIRTGGGTYNDERPLDILEKVIRVADPIPAILHESARISCEIENYPWVPGMKSARSIELEAYTNVMSTNGLITFSIHDGFLGANDPSGNIAPMMKAAKPYLQIVVESQQGKTREGISPPFDEKMRELNELNHNRLLPDWNVTLARIGIPQAPTKAWPCMLIGRAVQLYDDRSLLLLLEQGAVLDAEAYWLIRSRGLLPDSPIRAFKSKAATKFQKERIHAKHAPAWLKHKNLVLRWYISYLEDYVLDASPGADAWSVVYDAKGEPLTAGVVVADYPFRHAVVLYSGNPLGESGRQWLMQQAIHYVAQGERPPMIEELLNVYPIWWEGTSESLLGITHFGLEIYPTLNIWFASGKQIGSIQRLTRSGQWTNADYSAAPHPDGGVRIRLHGGSVPAPLSYETFRFKYER